MTKVTNYETGGQIDKTIEYVYDTFDRRVSSKVTDYTTNGSGIAVAGTPVVETYVFDEGAQSRGDVLLDFVDSDGAGGNAPAVAKRYLWGQAVDQLFAQEDVAGKLLADSDRYAWLLQDKLGTVREVLDRTGALIARVEYNAFGVIESVTNASGSPVALPTRFTFTAQEYDPVTGNIWFSNGEGRGRWYSPTQNRFLQPDELGFAAGDMNLYRYVGNSPTNATDPSGQNAEEWLATLPWQYQNFFSEEQRTVLVFGYYSALFKLERDYLLARAQYLRKAIERFEPYASSCSPGTRGGNMIAGMKQELTEIQSRFAENVAQAAELEARFNELGLHDVDFNVVIPNNDDRHSSHFGKGLSGARNLAAAFMSGWTGQSGGLQPSWDPFDVYAAGQGLVGLARGVMGLGRSAIAFGKNVREFSKVLSRSADDLIKELDELKNAPPKQLPCPSWQQSAADSQVLARRLGIQRGSRLDAHHIVPGNHGRAAPSQELLGRYQIDINSAENGVPLVGGRGAPQTTLPRHHRGSDLHSYKGIDAVNRRLENAARGIDDWATARQAIIDELGAIRAEIVAGTFP